MAEVLVARYVPYNVSGYNSLVLPSVKTSLYGVKTVRFIGKKLLLTLPVDIKEP